ncbi:MBL fold metallo-hydrolase [Candidatus Pantoea edessiphila]|uniref:Metallo-beta-lactamase domain-containing protein n=1 Tax=Candidatus Pantoea edessiphila TaxID=2044610 RepID=A0A2P5SWY5_9GAMM|nr:MBL fold metallo-hydrolase [Candidatus Pantoea edessiphila]PPI86858.1 hypothetical protein CRV10_01225 [Candidatus Pantoea edessiphila]
MNYHIIPVTSLMQNCCIIWCKSTCESAILDPGGNAENIKKILTKLNLHPVKILITHGHLDHIGSARELSEFYQIPIIGPHKFDKFLFESLSEQKNNINEIKSLAFTPNCWLKDNDKIQIGLLTFEVIHCPGHTPGHIVYFYRKGSFLFSGDVIFKGGIGRTDFHKSNYDHLINSINTKLLPLGDNITFIPGHGTMSTLGYEKINNHFLNLHLN